MPKCLKCGSYYIRAPCPVCSPPGVGQIIEDSKEAKGKSIEQLQSELKENTDLYKEKQDELSKRIRELTSELEKSEEEIQSLEVSKVGQREKLEKIQQEINDLDQEIESLKVREPELENEKEVATGKIKQLENRIVELKSQGDHLNQKIQEKQDAERIARETEKKELKSANLQIDTPEPSQEKSDNPINDQSNLDEAE